RRDCMIIIESSDGKSLGPYRLDDVEGILAGIEFLESFGDCETRMVNFKYLHSRDPRQRRRHVVLVRAQRVLRVLPRDAGGGGPTPDPVQGTRLERSGSRGRKSSERGFRPRGSGYIPSTDSGRGLPDRSSGYAYIGGKLIRKFGIGAFAALAPTGCSMAQDAGEVDAPHEETTVNIPTPSPTEESKPKAPVETETPKPKVPKLSDFNGMEGNDGVFDIRVNEAYVDEDNILSDGFGYYHTGQPGQEYVIF